MFTLRYRFRIDRAWVERREAALIAQEDAAIRLARNEAPSPELRAFVEQVISERLGLTEHGRRR